MSNSDDKRRADPSDSPAFFAHPKALVDSDAIGPGTRIWAFAHVLEGAIVGAQCNLGEGVFVEPGVVLGDRVTVKNGVQLWTGVTCEDGVFVGPNATFTNDLRPRSGRVIAPEDYVRTHVATGASIGANATIVCGHRIGRFALVGAGAVVTADVPDHALVLGNPGRRAGWVCECAASLPESLVCGDCGLAFQPVESGLKRRI